MTKRRLKKHVASRAVWGVANAQRLEPVAASVGSENTTSITRWLRAPRGNIDDTERSQ